MNRQEYECIQERLSRKLHDPKPKTLYGWPMGQREKEGYRNGISEAKSILHDIYHSQKAEDIIKEGRDAN